MTSRFKGIYPPLVTPLTAKGALDVDALDRQLERVIVGGVDGVFVLGSTGEAPSLSLRLKRDAVRETCRLTRSRVPILIGITDTCPEHSLDLAGWAADQGARAVVLSVPFYYPPNQAELETLARNLAARSPLPIFLYNIPMFTKAAFAPDTVKRLLDQPRIIGLKDSSGDFAEFRQLCELTRLREDWALLIGAEAMLAEGIAIGGHGGVPGGALVHPRLFADLCQAAFRGDTATVARLQPEVLKLGRIYRVCPDPAGVFKGVKCALALLGICSERMAEPLKALNVDEREQVRTILADCGLL